MIDSYLQRKSYLQRYIRGVTKSQLSSFSKGDREIVNALREFMDNASQRDITALLRNIKSNKNFGAFDALIVGVIANQTATTLTYLNSELSNYIESEINFNYRMFGSKKKKPKTKSILNTVIAGATITQTVNTMQSRTMERLRRDIASSVQSNTDPVKALKGTRELNYKDGLFFWRDERIYKPNIDRLINGAGWNARSESIKRIAPKTKYRWLGTLDGRMCKICAANEEGSPYEQGKTPQFPPHPRCRCELVPESEVEGERPFVSAFTSVSKIKPKDRKGKIGQVSGKTTYATWFANQDKKFQRKWLGKSRFELYRSGEYELTDFVDPRTKKIYTLEQLDILS